MEAVPPVMVGEAVIRAPLQQAGMAQQEVLPVELVEAELEAGMPTGAVTEAPVEAAEVGVHR